MSFKITASVTYVGKIDWELRKFHGEEYTTLKGSSYNSYLIKDEKNVLIDTVWGPFAGEFVENLAKEIDLARIDYIVINHGETDHSGALAKLLKEIPGTPVYCSANCVKSLRGQYHEEWNFHTAKTGERLNLGSKELVFIEAPMLHWPDTMFSFLTGENVLFSADAFGEHFASGTLFNDAVSQASLFEECLKYYANILTPFSRQVEKKINEVAKLNLPISLICPSHGVIWRNEPMQIIDRYKEWAGDYQENQITIIYDTMWNGTRRMAEEIARGIREADNEIAIKVFNSARNDHTATLGEVFKSKAVLIGSPTYNGGILSSVAGIIEEIRGLRFKNKRAAAFGTYGWSGEGVKVINEKLTEAGFELVNDGLKEPWHPGADSLDNCFNFGREIVQKLRD